MKRPTRRRHSPSHRVHHLLAGPLQPLPHHHRQVSQAAGVRVQVKLTWKHCSTALVKKEEDAQKKGFWSAHRPFVSSNWKRQALLIFTASWNANLVYHPMFMGSLFIQANYLPHHLLTQLPPHILVNLCFFKFSYFDRSRSPPAPAHPASVDRLKALPTVAPRQRWKGSADTGVITPRTPPSPRLNVPSPGFRNCPQNYHPGTRLKKGLFRHLLLTWYWAGWCSQFKKFKTYGSPLWVITPPFPDLTSFITPQTPPLPDFCILKILPQKYSPLLNHRPQLSTLVQTSKSASYIYSIGKDTQQKKMKSMVCPPIEPPGPSLPCMFFCPVNMNTLCHSEH